MARSRKLLDAMRRNPAADWTIADVQSICTTMGWQCLPPTGGGSHWKIVVPRSETILTVPARRPIKPIYIRKLTALMEAQENDDQGDR